MPIESLNGTLSDQIKELYQSIDIVIDLIYKRLQKKPKELEEMLGESTRSYQVMIVCPSSNDPIIDIVSKYEKVIIKRSIRNKLPYPNMNSHEAASLVLKNFSNPSIQQGDSILILVTGFNTQAQLAILLKHTLNLIDNDSNYNLSHEQLSKISTGDFSPINAKIIVI